MMQGWKTWLDTLDTPGGHVLLLTGLLLLGIAMVWLKLPKGDDILVGVFGALLGALRGTQKNGGEK
jgi:hypothetical protein